MFLGIDEGTTGATAVLLNEEGKLIAKKTAPIPQHFPQPGWVEHDPDEIYRAVEFAVRAALTAAQVKAESLKAIGITNQRETVSLFENSKALHRFIVWQDRRTAAECEKIQKKYGPKIRSLSGLPVDPYFSSSKIGWLLKELRIKSPQSRKDLRFRTIDSFLLKKLTGEDVTEATNASRTSLMNLKKCAWDSSLLSAFDIPKNLCPPIIPSEGFRLKTKGCSFLPDGIPVNACLGDQQAALFGQLGWKKGDGKITYGTGSFLLFNTGDKPVASKHGLVSTLALAWSNGKKSYAMEGSAFISGAWIQWLRDQLKMILTSKDSEALANSVSSSEGVFILPALSGLGAPFWKSHARGAILGLTRGSSQAHIARASLEALAFQNRALIDAIKKDLAFSKPAFWKVDGGAVENNLLLQIQADVLNEKISRPRNLEATGTGVALLAALSSKHLTLSDIQKTWELDREFIPSDAKSRLKIDLQYRDWFKFATDL